MTRYAFVEREKASYDIRMLCRLLRVSRSGYYAWAKGRAPSKRAVADEVLAEQIRTVHERSRRTYGAPRVHAELAEDGIRVGRKRVARLMRGQGMAGVSRRCWRLGCTRRDPAATPAPDLVSRQFVADRPDELWVADVTYVPTLAGWLYLAVVLDVYSRRVVGWSMSGNRKTQLVVDAVTMAVVRRGGDVAGVIHHSDQGGEGGFNRWSQHLVRLEVFDGASAAGGRSCGQAGDAVAWSAVSAKTGGAAVLAPDRGRHDE